MTDVKTGNPKGPPQRTRQEREQDYVTIARLYVQGQSQQQIADALGNKVSRRQIGKDLQVIRQRWVDSQVKDFGTIQAVQLAKLDLAEARAWDGFERSQQDSIKITTKSGRGNGDDGWPLPDEITTHREGQAGDPAFLKIILDCVEKRCKIFGLFAPEKHAMTDKNGNDLKDTDARRNRLAALLAAVYDRRGVGGDGDSLAGGEVGPDVSNGVCTGDVTGPLPDSTAPVAPAIRGSGNVERGWWGQAAPSVNAPAARQE